MIYFRCEQCAGAVRGGDQQAGTLVACPHCGHENTCPAHTTEHPALEASRPRAAAARPPGDRSTPSAFVRTGVVVFTTLSVGWGAWMVFVGPPDIPSRTSVTVPGTAADRRQAEILALAIDRPPDPALVRLYTDLNTRHFDGVLPTLPVIWEPRLAEVGPLAAQAFTLEGMFGHIGDRAAILLNPSLSTDADALRRALSHEMVHAYLYTIGDPSADHGPAFQATLGRLAREGAFTGIVATAEERESLKSWLQAESARLDFENDQTQRERDELAAEARELERAMAELQSRGPAAGDDQARDDWNRRRDAYDQRAMALRTRTERGLRDLAVFNEHVARYNLMLSYPDGLNNENVVANRR